jgi:S-DNA-T family DNA segregation ATPase FtsK/SpoIIIE
VASRRKSGSSRSRTKKKPQKVKARWREELSSQLAGHRSDMVAIALVVVGLLSLLAIVSDVVGPIGRGIDTLAATLLGNGKLLVPVALLVGAASLLLPRTSAAEDAEETPTRRGLRLGLGLVMVCAASVGLLYLGRTQGPVKRAGGLFGEGIGAPLRAGLGNAGAVIVLIAIAVLGALLVAGTGLRQITHACAAGCKAIVRHVRAFFAVPSERAEPGAPTVTDQSTPALFDQFAAAPAIGVDVVAADEVPEATGDELEEDEYEENEEEGEYAEEEYEEYDADEEDEDAGDDEPEDEEREHELAVSVPEVAWKLPGGSILKRSQTREVDPRMIEQGGEVLEATLREFGVDARLIGATVGPTVTRYELELAAGVKVNRVTNLNKEIAYSMASHDVRILAPIPGRSAIGVEVPNKMRPLVTLGDILSSDEAKKAKQPLHVGMGRDIAGRAVFADLSTFPHVLIAGQTGAGKSSCINSIVTSLLMRTTPAQVRLILVDPKRVELGQYNGVPHLLTEVVTNPKKAANALDWAVREMEMRYDLLADVGVRDIAGYNAMYDRGDIPTPDDPDPDTGKSYERLPFIVVVVDELADLMMVAARDVETSICRLAQMARAVGIHLVIATQRPSVDVITGVIKANIPSRLAFSVSTLADSRVILDQQGAEKLIGKGDMLMLSASSSRAERIQGAWVDEDCVRKVVAHWRRQVVQPNYVEGIQGSDERGGTRRSDDDEGDDLLDEAMELVVTSGLGSTSMLQRKLRVGFARAGRLMDLLERRGVVGPSEGSKARAVLMTVEELEELRERQ